MYSSSLLVIITTGKLACFCLISESVSKPFKPGMFSSKKTISKFVSSTKLIASAPFVQVVTL